MRIEDFDLLETLHRGNHITVGRYNRRSDGVRVVIKALAPAAQSAQHLSRLRYEQKILSSLAAAQHPSVPQTLGLIEAPGTAALVMADIGAQSLRTLLGEDPLSLREILHIAHQIAEALVVLHQARVVHKDINPNNIIYNRQTKQVQLIDFDLASLLAREQQPASNLTALEGTLAYLSPEQTGRTHAALDYRTDFYSLGVTLYELLTGHVPFAAADTAGVVHAILTQDPPPLHTWQVYPPEVVAAVVQKLMHKDAEQRYQSALGLRADLATCVRGLTPEGGIVSFELGSHDHSDRFAIPQRLYGREAEAARLLASYEQAAQGHSQLLLLAGPSGMGKSALVRELQGALVQHRALFGAGKYDLLRRNVPFSALREAMTQLVRLVLAEPEHELELLRRRMQEALGNVGQPIVDLAPDVELLVGPQKKVPALPPQETENRLLMVLRRFVLALCKRQPLVLFLDDLQWADRSTLKLIRQLATETQVGAGLLILGAYRSDEVDGQHALHTEIIDGLAPETVQLTPMGRGPVTALISDTTRAPGSEAALLADVLLPKTGGNPFLLQECLKDLWRRELLVYQPQAAARWHWDLTAIQGATVTDSIAQLITRRLDELRPEARTLLSVAACLGHEFSLRMLLSVQDRSRAEVLEHLQTALQLGVLLPHGHAYRYAEVGDAATDPEYHFAHDRVQQAAYNLLAPDTAAQLHQRIGMEVLNSADAEHPEKWIFTVADHLNRGLPPATAEEAVQRVQLNLQAGQHARLAVAHALAVEYLQKATSMLSDDAWSTHPDLARNVLFERADMEYAVGRHAEAAPLLDEVLRRATSADERAELHRRRSGILTGGQEYADALSASLLCLRELGVRAPTKASPIHVLIALLQLKWSLRGRAIRDLADAPFMTDPRQMAIAAAWLSIAVPAFHSNPTYFVFGVLRTSVLMVRHGLAKDASGFRGLVILNSLLGDYTAAKDWAYLVQQQLDRLPDLKSRGVSRYVLANLAHLENAPINLVDVYQPVIECLLEEGQPGAASKVVAVQLFCRMLVSVDDAARARPNSLLSGKVPGVMQEDNFIAQCIAQVREALQGNTESVTSLNDAAFNEASAVGVVQGTATWSSVHLMKLLLAWVARDFAAALEHAEKAEANSILRTTTDNILLVYHFFVALSVTQHMSQGGRTTRRQRRWLKRASKRLHKAAQAGAVYVGVPWLIDAEQAANRGDHLRAQALYQRAHDGLPTSGHTVFVAAGWECAARYWQRQGQTAIALAHLEKAKSAYETWGATLKVEALERELGHSVMEEVPSTHHTTHRSTKRHTSGGEMPQIDLPALMEAAQALSGDMPLDTLVQNILAATQRTASASRAVLLLRVPNGKLQTVADTTPGNNDLPHDIITYALRTHDAVVLNDVANQTVFRDVYLQRSALKALLAVPLMHHGKASGVLYLENHVATGTFLPSRINLVKFLGAQAASALESATLHAHLEEVVSQRTTELRATHARLLAVEKQSTEMQMAGGFAHEMLNALSSARMPLASLTQTENDPAVLSLMQQALGTLRREHTAHAPTMELLRQLEDDRTLLQDALTAIEGGLERGLSITHEILNYAEVGSLTPGDHTVALTPLVDSILKEFAESFANEHIHAACDIDAQLRVMMREEHAHTIVRNLIANSRDALTTSPSGVQRHIELSAHRHNDFVEFRVRDNGRGMSPHVQQRVFQPFFSTKGAHGAGLSLGLCKKLLQVYGGEISFSSQPEQGTEFRLQLPRAAQ